MSLYSGVAVKALPAAIHAAPTPELAISGLLVAEALTRPGGVDRLQAYLEPAAVAYRPEIGADASRALGGISRDLDKSPGRRAGLQAELGGLRRKLYSAAGLADEAALKERLDAFFAGTDDRPLPAREPNPAVVPASAADVRRTSLYKADAKSFSSFPGIFARYSAWNASKPPRPWTLRYWRRFRKEETLSRAVWKKLRSLGPSYVVLAADPGVALRAGRFVDFARGFDYKAYSPWELREKFKEHLGRRTVYRALVLEKGAEAAVIAGGMEAPGTAQSGTAPSTFNLFREMGDHMLVLGPRKDRLVSVTEDPGLALSVAYNYASPRYANNDVLLGKKDLYLFKLAVPELDLVDPHANYGYLLGDPGSRRVGYFDLDGKSVETTLDGRLESVVYGGIQADEIESVVRVTADDLVASGRLRRRFEDLGRPKR